MSRHMQIANGYEGFTQRLEQLIISKPAWKDSQGIAPVVVPQPRDNRVPNAYPSVSFNIRYTTSDVRYQLQAFSSFFLLIEYWAEASSDADTAIAISNIARYRDAFAAAFTGKYKLPLRVRGYQFSTSGAVEQVPRHPKIFRLSDQILVTVPR